MQWCQKLAGAKKNIRKDHVMIADDMIGQSGGFQSDFHERNEVKPGLST